MDLGDEDEIKPRLVPEEEYNSVQSEVNELGYPSGGRR